MNDIARVQTEQQQLAPAATPADLLRIAVESNADIDKLEKLMAMQERWEASQAKKAFVLAMSRFRDQCPEIDKTRAAHNSKYAGLAETLKSIKGLLADNGLSHSWRTDQHDGLITVTCCITHEQGHSECTSLSGSPDTSGSKNAIQSIGSTVTYLQRYTLYAILGLASKDQDDDGNGSGKDLQRITETQVADLECLIGEVKADKSKFLKYMQAGTLAEIQASQYERAVSMLEKKRKA